MSGQRIQRRCTKGWRIPEGAVYVGRGTKWGNPFRVGNNEEFGEVPTREEAVSLFERWWTTPAKFIIPWPPPLDDLLALRGKDLACWCRIDLPCHADVLMKLAERYGRFRDENPQCFAAVGQTSDAAHATPQAALSLSGPLGVVGSADSPKTPGEAT